MEATDTTTLVIQEHNFQEAKNSLKKYAAKRSSELSLPTVPRSGGLFGLGNHKVTGDELNNVTSQIQDNFIDINKLAQGLIGELGQVYKAFESLDKDYITGIVGSIKAIEKVSIEEQKDRAELKKTVKTLEKTVEALKGFKKDIEKLKHITDVDKAWELIASQKRVSDSLVTYKDKLSKLTHIMDADIVWRDVASLKKELPEINKLVQGLNGDVAKIQAAISDLNKKQEEFEKKIDKKLSEHFSSINQRLEEQKNGLDATLADTRTELSQQIGLLSEQQENRMSDIENTQAEALANLSQEQKSNIEVLKKKQDDATASMFESIESEKAYLQETIATLEQKLKIAYIVAGTGVGLALIHFILNIIGVL